MKLMFIKYTSIYIKLRSFSFTAITLFNLPKHFYSALAAMQNMWEMFSFGDHNDRLITMIYNATHRARAKYLYTTSIKY